MEEEDGEEHGGYRVRVWWGWWKIWIFLGSDTKIDAEHNNKLEQLIIWKRTRYSGLSPMWIFHPLWQLTLKNF